MRFLKQSLVAASVIMIGANILSRVFGFAREAVIAGYFGTATVFDTFILALTIPEFLSAIIFVALPAAMIPSLKKIRVNSDVAESESFWSGLVIFTVIFAIVSILIYSLRGDIFRFLAPQISEDQFNAGNKLMAILSWVVFFRGTDAYFRSWLFEKKHFIAPATSNILSNVVILTALFLLYGKINIDALAYGWLLGSAIVCIYNGYIAIVVVKPMTKFWMNNRFIAILLRSTLIIAIVQCIPLLYPVIDRYLASRYLGPGHIAALRYAMILIQIPTGIFVIALNITFFPWISDLSVPQQLENLKKLYRDNIRLLVYTMGLVAVAVAIFSQEIIGLAYYRGAFDHYSLKLTSGPLTIYALGIALYSIYIFQMRFYYARQNLLRLGMILFIAFILKIVLSMLLVGPMQQNGLALATTIAWVFAFSVMTVDVGKILRVSITDLFYPSIYKTLLSFALVAIYWIVMRGMWHINIEEGTATLFFKMAVFAISGIALYLGLGVVLKIPEQERVFGSLFSRLRRIKRGS